jgi:hypothetical protein
MAVKTDLSIAKGSSRKKGEKIPAQEELKQERLAFAASRTVGLRSAGPIAKPEPEGGF